MNLTQDPHGFISVALESIDQALDVANLVQTSADTVEKHVEQGVGLNEATGGMINAVLTHANDVVGVEQPATVSVSTESFGTLKGRMQYAQASLESIKDNMKAILEVILNAIRKVIEWIKSVFANIKNKAKKLSEYTKATGKKVEAAMSGKIPNPFNKSMVIPGRVANNLAVVQSNDPRKVVISSISDDVIKCMARETHSFCLLSPVNDIPAKRDAEMGDLVQLSKAAIQKYVEKVKKTQAAIDVSDSGINVSYFVGPRSISIKWDQDYLITSTELLTLDSNEEQTIEMSAGQIKTALQYIERFTKSVESLKDIVNMMINSENTVEALRYLTASQSTFEEDRLVELRLAKEAQSNARYNAVLLKYIDLTLNAYGQFVSTVNKAAEPSTVSK